MRKRTFLGFTAAATLCATLGLMAQDTKDAGAPTPEMMARMAPGPMHKKLEPLIGKYEMTGKFRMAPEEPWQELKADVERKWILDGRFIEETVHSDWMGQPWEGRGVIGYDNVRQQFTMIWFESMSTGTSSSTGKLDGTKIVFEGTNSDAMTGEKDRWSKMVIDLASPQQLGKGYCKDKAGKEFEMMEMSFAKK